MKKILLILALLPMVFLASCSSDDDGLDVPELTTSNTIRITMNTGSERTASFAIKGSRIYIDWGDGQTTWGKSPKELGVYQHTYATEGSYTIKIWSDEITSFILEGRIYTTNVDYVGFGNSPQLISLHVKNVNHLDGLGEYSFPNLTNVCAYNIHETPGLSFRGCPELKELYCNGNPALMSVDISANPKLQKMVVYHNNFDVTAMNRMFSDLPAGTSQNELFCYGNPGSATCNTSIAEDKGWTVNNFE